VWYVGSSSFASTGNFAGDLKRAAEKQLKTVKDVRSALLTGSYRLHSLSLRFGYSLIRSVCAYR
jgi:hypothetical protein